MKLKQNKDIKLISFDEILKWVRLNNTHEDTPIMIQKAGDNTPPFRLWCFGDVLLLMSNEQDASQQQYVLTREKWDLFCQYVISNPTMNRTGLKDNYREYGCTNYAFWPAIIHICTSYYSSQKP